MSKILITGASGFIGRALVSKLITMGWDVKQVNSADGDIASRDTLAKFSRQEFEHFFHLAGKTFVPDSWEEPQKFCQTNVQGTINALDFCSKKNIPITYISAYVYGHPDSLPISENSIIHPSNPYALTKRLAEEACEFYASTYELPVTTIRPFNVYGIGQAEYFLIPEIINQVFNEGEEVVVKDLAPRRDYVYLEDLVSGLIKTMDKSDGYRVFNIGSGVSISVQDVIDIIQVTANTNKKVVCKNVARRNELMDVVADISKAKIELGWQPEFTFQAGIKNIIHLEQKRKCNEQA